MAQHDPAKRDSSFLARLFKGRAVEPVPPAPSVTPPPEPETPKRKPRPQPSPGGMDATQVPSAFYTGQTRRQPKPRARQTPTAAFAVHSDSERIKQDQEFDRRFKGEVARAMGRDAMADAAKAREALKDEQIERLRELKVDLHRLCSTGRPVGPEAGLDINQKFDEAFERHDREMEEVGRHLERTLDRAAALDLTIDIKRQKLLGYTPHPVPSFNRVAEPGPEPDRATEQPTRSSHDDVSVWLAEFNRVAPPPPVPPHGPDR